LKSNLGRFVVFLLELLSNQSTEYLAFLHFIELIQKKSLDFTTLMTVVLVGLQSDSPNVRSKTLELASLSKQVDKTDVVQPHKEVTPAKSKIQITPLKHSQKYIDSLLSFKEEIIADKSQLRVFLNSKGQTQEISDNLAKQLHLFEGTSLKRRIISYFTLLDKHSLILAMTLGSFIEGTAKEPMPELISLATMICKQNPSPEYLLCLAVPCIELSYQWNTKLDP